jgi:hypothetical protein
MFAEMACFLLGLLYANLGEWLMHKYLLHGLGKNNSSFWAYHYQHHAVCAKHGMLDSGYQPIKLTGWNSQTKELVVLTLIMLIHTPVYLLSPAFVTALYFSIVLYYYLHRKAHLNPLWASTHLRWHYDHHLGSERNANWCITWPGVDYVLGTRKKTSLR